MPEVSSHGPRFYTVAEVAEFARVSRMTVYRMVHSGELPAVRVGGSYRVPASAVEQLLGGAMGDQGGEERRLAK
nr:helix-turn-helix domain-containing protein [Neoactinobaculum massilliense]